MKKAEKEYYEKMTSIEKEMLSSCYNQFYDLVSVEACKTCEAVHYCACYDVAIYHNGFKNGLVDFAKIALR
jgi:hypothetical protein